MSRNSNGDGSVFRRKDGRWQASCCVGFAADGKLIRKYFYGYTRKEAVEKMQKFKDNDGKKSKFDDALKLNEWLNIWLNTYKKHAVKPRTFEQYESVIRLYLSPTLGEIPLRDLHAFQVQNLLNSLYEKGLSRRSVEIVRIVLHAALNQARKIKILSEVPTEDLVLPRKEKYKPRVLTEEEQNILIEELQKNYVGRALVFALFTGLRRGEILALEWSDFDTEEKSINICKGLSRVRKYDCSGKKTSLEVSTPKLETSIRTVPLIDKAIDLLKFHKAEQEKYKSLVGNFYHDQNVIFSSSTGGYIDPGNLNRKLKLAAEKIGIPPLSSHAMRHTFATRGLEAGVSMKAMQEFLGHSSIQITGDIYTHLLKKQKKLEIDKMNNIF